MDPTDTDFVEVHCGRKFCGPVEFAGEVSGPEVVELVVELDGLGGASHEADFATPLPAGAQLITIWLEGTPTSSDPNTNGLSVDIGPPADPDGWMDEASAPVGGSPSQGTPGDLWTGLPPVVTVETAPKASLTPSGSSPDLAHLSGEVTAKVLYRRTRTMLP